MRSLPLPSAWTSALSTSDSSSSRHDAPSSAHTASASASVHPPANTARRRKRRCSGSLRSEWLHSIVARSVCWRPARRGRRTGGRRVRGRDARAALRARGAAGAPRRVRPRAEVRRAAGRSPRPPRAFAGVSSSDGARATKSATDGPSSSGGSAYSRSAAIRNGRPARRKDVELGAGGDELRHLRGGGLNDLFEIVEQQEHLAVSDQPRDRRRRACAPRTPSRRAHRQARGRSLRPSATSANGTNATPSRNSGASRRPSSASVRVLPTPPGPVIVTTRFSRARPASVARSPSLAMSEVALAGRLLGSAARRSPFPSSKARVGNDETLRGRPRTARTAARRS